MSESDNCCYGAKMKQGCRIGSVGAILSVCEGSEGFRESLLEKVLSESRPGEL